VDRPLRAAVQPDSAPKTAGRSATDRPAGAPAEFDRAGSTGPRRAFTGRFGPLGRVRRLLQRNQCLDRSNLSRAAAGNRRRIAASRYMLGKFTARTVLAYSRPANRAGTH